MTLRGSWSCSCLALLLAACTGSIVSDPRPGPPEGPGPGRAAPAPIGGAGGSAPVPPGPAPAAPPAPGRLRLLTRAQLENSLRDLLGATTLGPTQQDTATHGFASVSASSVTLTDSGVEQVHTALRSLLGEIAADPTRRKALTGECTPAGADDEACFKRLITAFGRRAWRRPLAVEEIDRYTRLAVSAGRALGGDPNRGLQYGFAGLLGSPHFLYRVEIGAPDPAAGGRHRYTAHELASRLSYFLTASTPDANLLAAADSGALDRPEGVRAEVTRLLASPRGRQGMSNYARELMDLDDFKARVNAENDPRYTPSLRAAMAEEVSRLFQSRLDPGVDLLELLDTTRTQVNAELARIYGIPGITSADLVPASFPPEIPRAGLLGMGVYLAGSVAGKGKDTSPTGRGIFVVEAILCREVPDPPGDVDTNLRPVPPGVVLTNRERLIEHMKNPGCAACHAVFDPIGFAFESFDWVGAHRTKVGDKVIDSSIEWEGERFADARELVRHIRKMPEAQTCFLKHLFRYANGHKETAADEAQMARWEQALAAAGGQLPKFLLELTAGPDFRYVSSVP